MPRIADAHARLMSITSWVLPASARAISRSRSGVKAIKNGFSAQHYVLDDLMLVLKADAAVPPARLKAKRYLNSAPLIIDEIGFRPLDRHEANLFFRFVSARYERGSIVLT
jgi:DNA replication protein DnaC